MIQRKAAVFDLLDVFLIIIVSLAIPPNIVGKRSFTADLYNCLAQDLSFKEVYQQFYAASPVNVSRSFSHHHIWSVLSTVRLDCRNILIIILANTYGYHHRKTNYGCTPVERKSTTVSSLITNSQTTMTTPTTYPTTTTQTDICNGEDLTRGINNPVVLAASGNCPSPVFHSEEIFDVFCSLPSHIPEAWKPGPKVLDMCLSLPKNTAVATFTNGRYDPLRDIAAIFVGCIDTSTGFRAAIALCNEVTSIKEVTYDNDLKFHSPDNYYVLLSGED